jgi:hypothetical protein
VYVCVRVCVCVFVCVRACVRVKCLGYMFDYVEVTGLTSMSQS